MLLRWIDRIQSLLAASDCNHFQEEVVTLPDALFAVVVLSVDRLVIPCFLDLLLDVESVETKAIWVGTTHAAVRSLVPSISGLGLYLPSEVQWIVSFLSNQRVKFRYILVCALDACVLTFFCLGILLIWALFVWFFGSLSKFKTLFNLTGLINFVRISLF